MIIANIAKKISKLSIFKIKHIQEDLVKKGINISKRDIIESSLNFQMLINLIFTNISKKTPTSTKKIVIL